MQNKRAKTERKINGTEFDRIPHEISQIPQIHSHTPNTVSSIPYAPLDIQENLLYVHSNESTDLHIIPIEAPFEFNLMKLIKRVDNLDLNWMQEKEENEHIGKGIKLTRLSQVTSKNIPRLPMPPRSKSNKSKIPEVSIQEICKKFRSMDLSVLTQHIKTP